MTAKPNSRLGRSVEDISRSGRDEKNPFLDDRNAHVHLPSVPDTKECAFLWVRVELGGEADGVNVTAQTTGRLKYVPCDGTESPEVAHLATNLTKDGMIRVNDVALMKTERKMRDWYLEACQIQAEQKLAMTEEGAKGAISYGGHTLLRAEEGHGSYSTLATLGD
jgi:hypothetical protein